MQGVSRIQVELAERGVGMGLADLLELLNLAADIANLMGGYVVLDAGANWGLEMELDEDRDDGAYVRVIDFLDDEAESDADDWFGDDVSLEEMN